MNYIPPFTNDGSNYIYDDVATLAFTFLQELSEPQIDKILISLNSKNYKPLVYKQAIKLEYIKERKVITLNGKDFILLRGWYELLNQGYMTIEAEEIQENLIKYIINKLQ